MKALCWHGTRDVRIDTVPDPRIEDKGDILIKGNRDRHLRVGLAHPGWLRAGDGER